MNIMNVNRIKKQRPVCVLFDFPPIWVFFYELKSFLIGLRFSFFFFYLVFCFLHRFTHKYSEHDMRERIKIWQKKCDFVTFGSVFYSPQRAHKTWFVFKLLLFTFVTVAPRFRTFIIYRFLCVLALSFGNAIAHIISWLRSTACLVRLHDWTAIDLILSFKRNL